MKTVIRKVLVVRYGDTTILRERSQDGRRHRRIWRRSGNSSLEELISARVIKDPRIRRIPNGEGVIHCWEIGLRHDCIAVRIYDCRRARGRQHDISVVGIKRRNRIVPMLALLPAHRNRVGDARDGAAKDGISVALSFPRWSKGIVIGRNVDVGVVYLSAGGQTASLGDPTCRWPCSIRSRPTTLTRLRGT